MLKWMLGAAVLATAMPAAAQMSGQSGMTSDPSQAQQMQQMQQMQDQQRQAQDQTQPSGQDGATTNDVAGIVTNDWSTYDADGSKGLDQAEFGKWMLALRKADPNSAAMGAEEQQQWVAAAMKMADGDGNGSVSQSELTSFLQR